jgi:chromosome segregation ATPase
MDPDYHERECARLNAELAKAWAEIADLRARLDAEASHRLSLGADNDRLLAEIERLRAELALRKDYADQCRAQDATIHRLKLELDAYERAVREARDGVS